MKTVAKDMAFRFLHAAAAAFLFAAVIAVLCGTRTVSAKTTTYLGYTGIYEDGTYYSTVDLTHGSKGVFAIDTSSYPYWDMEEIVSVKYKVGNSEKLTVDTDGNYKAVGYGTTKVTVTVKYREYEGASKQTVKYKYVIRISPNMSKIELNKSELTVYVSDSYYAAVTSTVKIKKSGYSFSDGDGLTDLSVTSSNSNVYAEASVKNNVITLSFYADSSCSSTIRITLNDRTFKIKVKVIKVSCSTDSALLYPGKTKTVKVKGKVADGTKIKWSSSNKKVATVNSSGVITAKGYGNAIITATVNGQVKVGLAVSVTTKTKVKAIKKAISIAETSTYSQSKRMQDGYYDCSALVWKSYSAYGVYFGSKTYAPTAAGLAEYLNSKGKLKGSCTYEQTQKMVMRAGDVAFKTGADNGRYEGIYHAELFAGYALSYYDWNGDPVVTTTWAARDDGYAMEIDLYGRP